jgi:hypothetical protein
VLTIENVLASMIAEEQAKMRREDGDVRTPVAEWIHAGMSIERQQWVFFSSNFHAPILMRHFAELL